MSAFKLASVLPTSYEDERNETISLQDFADAAVSHSPHGLHGKAPGEHKLDKPSQAQQWESWVKTVFWFHRF